MGRRRDERPTRLAPRCRASRLERPVLLIRRIQRLEATIPHRLPPLPGIDPRWQSIARTNPEARRRALLFAERTRALWPDGPFDESNLIKDEECFDHYVFLETNRFGSLDEWFSSFLDEKALQP